jgi:hypothetical protein
VIESTDNFLLFILYEVLRSRRNSSVDALRLGINQARAPRWSFGFVASADLRNAPAVRRDCRGVGRTNSPEGRMEKNLIVGEYAEWSLDLTSDAV